METAEHRINRYTSLRGAAIDGLIVSSSRLSEHKADDARAGSVFKGLCFHLDFKIGNLYQKCSEL